MLWARRVWWPSPASDRPSAVGPRTRLAGDRAFAARMPFLQRLFENKWYVDELYDRIVIRPVKWLARMC